MGADGECREARAALGSAEVRPNLGVWLEDAGSGFEEEQRQTECLEKADRVGRGVESMSPGAHGDIFGSKQKATDGAKHCFKHLYIVTHIIFSTTP